MTIFAANLATSTFMMTGLMANAADDHFLSCGLGLVEAPADLESPGANLSGPMTQQVLGFFRWRYGQIAKQLHRDSQSLEAPYLTPYDAMRARMDVLQPREQQPIVVRQAMIPSELFGALAEHSLKILIGEQLRAES